MAVVDALDERAVAVGCSPLGTFSSRFTELVGMPPSTLIPVPTGHDPGDAMHPAKR